MSEEAIERQPTLETVNIAARWTVSHPTIPALFLVVGLLGVVGQESLPVGAASIALAMYAQGYTVGSAGKFTNVIEGGHGAVATRVLDKYLSLVGISLVTGLLAAVTVFALVLIAESGSGIPELTVIIVLLYVSLRLSLAFAACVIDDRSAIDSLVVSWDAAAGNLLKLLGIALVSFFYFLLVSYLVTTFVPVLDFFRLTSITIPAGTAPSAIHVGVIAALTFPIPAFAQARVYLENRTTRHHR